MIRPCTCDHPGQDSLHGKGQRVWNHAIKFRGGPHHGSAPRGGVWRCTVCGRQVERGEGEKE